jgi:hypothetical protein
MTKKNLEIQLPAGVTAEMLAAWKATFGEKKIKAALLTSDDEAFEPFEVVMRVPGRVEMSEFEKWLDKKPDKAKEIILKACLLTHKDDIMANDDKFLAAFNALAEILPVQKAVIKNL